MKTKRRQQKYLTLAILTIVLSISTFSFAQKHGQIKGTVTDGKNAIEFVEIQLRKSIDSTKINNFAISDFTGNFSIENLENGVYFIEFKLFGYKTVLKEIQISSTNSTVILENILLQSTTNVLSTVEITTHKKALKKTNEGIIFNVSSSISQMGGTAIDLLKNIPTVSVDAEGGVSVRGKTPLILINGKNSTITNLNQIAASNIENIEVLTNPSAKYDANAESGIINIKLKKNDQKGINGAVALGAGFGAKGRVNSSVLLNHKTNQWNFGLGYDNRFAGRTKKIEGSRTNYFIAEEHFINQKRNDIRKESLQNLKLNIDFFGNENNTFSFEAIANKEGQDNDESLKTEVSKQDYSFFSTNKRHSLELERSKVGEFALLYDHKFSDQRENLTASITSSFNKDRENTAIDTYNFDVNSNLIEPILLQKTHNYENENISNAIINYELPISKNTTLETGYKGIFRFFNSDFQSADFINDEYVINKNSSNQFKYNEQINAVYGQLNSASEDQKIPRLKYTMGIRAEQVNNSGNTKNKSDHFSNTYFKIFPTFALQWIIRTDESIKLSYSKRINRPELDQLNPFVDITDALNPHSGNPYLKPEIINSGEINYIKEWKKNSLTISGFYRNANNSIKQYSELKENGVILLYPRNFGNTITYGIESLLITKFSSHYDAIISLTGFQQNIDGSNIAEDVVTKAFNWYGKIINNFTPFQGGKLQIIGNYNSALSTPQGKRIAIYSTDLGFQQKLSNGNSRLGLSITDLFNTLKSGYINNTANFNNKRISKADTRSFFVTFAYSFKSSFKEKLMESQFKPEY